MILSINLHKINNDDVIEQLLIVGPNSLGISIVAACFVGLVFTLQVIQEFLYLDATSLIGAVLVLSFIRELSPVLMSVIIIGRIGSSFTAEIATMQITKQIDALYLLRIDPLVYLVVPRVIACMLMMPVLNIFFFLTSTFSGIFTCFLFYGVHPWVFLKSVCLAIFIVDLLKSTLKVVVFGCILSVCSCYCGFMTKGSSRNVGKSTTLSVVINLLMIFIFDFVLSYLMFDQSVSSIRVL